MGELHERNIKQQSWVGGVTHLDQDLAHLLHRSHDCRRAHSLSLIGDFGCTLIGQLNEFGCHQRQEAITEVTHDVLGENARIAALLHRKRECCERLPGIVRDEGLDELVIRQRVWYVTTGGSDELERAQRVSCGASALSEHCLECFLGDLEAGIGGHPPNVLFEFIHRQKVKFEMLHS